MTELISMYNGLSSPVYTCFVDASKAYGRVNPRHLFHQLLTCGMRTIIIKLFNIWYTSQLFVVKWGNCISEALQYQMANDKVVCYLHKCVMYL